MSVLGTSPIKTLGASGFRNVGSYASPSSLVAAWPSPQTGLYAGVWFDGVSENQSIYTSDAGVWSELYAGDFVLVSDFIKPKLQDVSKTMTYNLDGSIATLTDAYGSKTFSYNLDGSLASIAGTGTYQSKTFSYSGGNLVSVTVS